MGESDEKDSKSFLRNFNEARQRALNAVRSRKNQRSEAAPGPEPKAMGYEKDEIKRPEIDLSSPALTRRQVWEARAYLDHQGRKLESVARLPKAMSRVQQQARREAYADSKVEALADNVTMSMEPGRRLVQPENSHGRPGEKLALRKTRGMKEPDTGSGGPSV